MKKLIIVFSLIAGSVVGQTTIKRLPEKTLTFEQLMEWSETSEKLINTFNGKDHVDSVLFYLNEYRTQLGLPSLTIDDSLTKMALMQSTYCADELKLTHKYKSQSFKMSEWDRHGARAEIVALVKIKSLYAFDTTIPICPIDGFKKSYSHDLIMKHPDYTECGIALVLSPKDNNTYFTTIVFK
tara:strand:- start:1312 stop:1860 length:549 start_codon:yes stop_codon:yes gene_type:complete